jgi:MFS family permease
LIAIRDSFVKIEAAFYAARVQASERVAKLKPQVILLGLVSLLNDSASEMLFPLLPVFLTTTLGATPVVIGLIEGAADGLASILKYFAGLWSDRMPKRKPFIVTGYSLAVVARLIIASAVAWPMVLGARLLDRTGKGIRSAPRDALISDVTPPEQRGRAFGFHRALDHTGAIIGPLLAFALLQGLGLTLRQAFFCAVVPGAIGVFVLVFFLREQDSHPAAAKKIATDVPLPGRFRGAITAIALFSLSNSSDAFLILQAHAAGVSTAMLPMLWAAHHVIKSLFSTAFGSLSDRIDRRYLLFAGWLSYAVIYAIFPFAKSLLSFVILFVLYAIPFTVSEGAERAWIADLVPPEARGKSFGIFYLVSGLCVLAGTALFGLLYQKISPQAAFFTGAGLAVGAAIMVLAVGRRPIAVAP